MSNSYFNLTDENKLYPNTRALSKDVNELFQGVATGFEKLPEPTTGGFAVPVVIGQPSQPNHAATRSYVESMIVAGMPEQFVATSQSHLTISTGLQFLTIESGKGFVPGMIVRITAKDNTSAMMEGPVAHYLGTSLAVQVTDIQSAGFGGNDWGIVMVTPIDPGLPRPYPPGYFLSNDGTDLLWKPGAGTTQSIPLLTSEQVLSASSARSIYIGEARQTGAVLRLPDATTLQVDDQWDVYLDSGIVVIRDGSGDVIASITADTDLPSNARHHETFRLSDNSTPAGVWLRLQFADSEGSKRRIPYSNTHVTQNATITTLGHTFYNQFFDLSGGRYLQAASQYNTARILTVTDYPLAVSAGTANTIAPNTYIGGYCVVNKDKILTSYNGHASPASSSSLRLAICSLSGSVISGPFITSVTSADSNVANEMNCTAALTSTTALWLYSKFQTSGTYTRIVTISGTSATASSEALLGTSLYYPASMLIPLSSTKVLWVYANPQSSNYITARTLTISGVTVTASTPVVIASIQMFAYDLPRFVVIDASNVLLSYSGYVYYINIDGPTPVVKSSAALTAAYTFSPVPMGGDLYFIGDCTYKVLPTAITNNGPTMFFPSPTSSTYYSLSRPNQAVLGFAGSLTDVYSFYPLIK